MKSFEEFLAESNTEIKLTNTMNKEEVGKLLKQKGATMFKGKWVGTDYGKTTQFEHKESGMNYMVGFYNGVKTYIKIEMNNGKETEKDFKQSLYAIPVESVGELKEIAKSVFGITLQSADINK